MRRIINLCHIKYLIAIKHIYKVFINAMYIWKNKVFFIFGNDIMLML